MRNRPRYLTAVVASLCIALTSIGGALAQAPADWRAQRVVPAKRGAKAAEPKPAEAKRPNIGRSEARLKHVLPATPDERCVQPKAKADATEAGANLTAGSSTNELALLDEVTAQDVVLYPCCDCNRILLDGIFLYANAPLSVFNSTPNSVVTVTLTHDGPGTILFALALDGPYVDSLNFDVTTNSSGNGVRPITFFIKGVSVGQSNMRTILASGSTNPVPQMEVFACQCP